jgi:hypothetical protein
MFIYTITVFYMSLKEKDFEKEVSSKESRFEYICFFASTDKRVLNSYYSE